MATENKGVMIYLPKDVEEYITNFCTEYNITRKDKEGNLLPSLGTGVVTYLKSKISGESPDEILTKPSRTLGTGLTKDEVLDLIREHNTSVVINPPSSGSPSNGLTRDEVIDLISECVTTHLSGVGVGNGLTRDEVMDLIASDRLSNSPSTPSRRSIEAVDLETATDVSWGAFHQAVGIDASNSKKSAELGTIAIAKATEMGFAGWKFNGNKQRFYRNSP